MVAGAKFAIIIGALKRLQLSVRNSVVELQKKTKMASILVTAH